MPHIETTQIDKITVIRMCLENRMNSLEKELRDELKQCLQQFSTNKDSHVAVLTGVGKAFCAGGSLKELEGGMRDIAAAEDFRTRVQLPPPPPFFIGKSYQFKKCAWPHNSPTFCKVTSFFPNQKQPGEK